MATSRSEEYASRTHVVDESSKSVWYLILLTLSIGGYVLYSLPNNSTYCLYIWRIFREDNLFTLLI